MLRLPPFDFQRPRSLREAAQLLADGGAGEGRVVRLVAGGTDLWPNMKRRHQGADRVVSLMGIPELSRIGGAEGRGGTTGDSAGRAGELRLGATATLTRIAAHETVRGRYPALAQAVRSISAPVLRNMGTLGGNLCLDTRCTYYNQNEEWRQAIDYCMKEQGEICWVAPSSPRCWAISASDSAPILCALGARVRLVSVDGERSLPLAGLYRDDGIDYLAKRPDEVLTEVLVPAEADCHHARSAFLKLRRRGSIDFAVLTVGASVWTDSAKCVTRASLYLGAVASLPRAVPQATEALVGQPLDEGTIAAAARGARKVATPLDNTDFQAQWRGQMVERYVVRALRQCADLPAVEQVGS